MADVTIEVGRFSTPTSTGNVDFTTADLGGKTPVAIMVIKNRAITDGTPLITATGGIGFCTGASNEFGMSFNAKDGLTTTIAKRRIDNAQVISFLDFDGVLDIEATFVSFISDGVRLNFSNINATARLFTIIFFAGADVSAHANIVTVSATVDTATDITDPAFEPDLVLFACTGQDSDLQTTGQAIISFGAAHNGASIDQKGILYSNRDVVTTTELNLFAASNRCAGQVFNGSLSWAAEISDFDANGFSITPRTAGSGSDRVIYLALKFTGVSSWVGSFDSPAATGDDAQTGPSFKPQAVILGMSAAQAEDAVEADADAGPFGISCFTPDAEFSNSWAGEDAVTTSNEQSLSDNQAVNLDDDAGSAMFDATFSTMDADGWTLNFSVADGTARKWFGIAIQEAPAVTAVNLIMAPYTPA